MTAGAAVPPVSVVRAALRRITEFLARELAQPSAVAPDWSDVEWTLARAVAAMHGVSPLLSTRLRWKGPDDWNRFLDEQSAHTRHRYLRIVDMLHLLDARTRDLDIPGMALKGAELHALGVYVGGERPMADIDLLVRPADAERTAGMLRSLGFRETSTSWKEREFTPAGHFTFAALGEHAHSHIKIELHERICERLPLRISDVTARVFAAHATPGLNRYSSKASLMLHLLLHAAGAMAFQSLRLLHLHDLAALASQLTEQDWNEVQDSRDIGRLWWALPPLRLAARYYGRKIPPQVLARAARDCPLVLDKLSARRVLSDVSYSHLRIDAFPGIEWSQSPSLALEYAVSRIRPSAEHVAWRHAAADSGWMAGSEWSGLSQGRRILRWLGSRPVRPVSMHAVRAAFAVGR